MQFYCPSHTYPVIQFWTFLTHYVFEGLPFLEDDNDENGNETKTYLFLLLERGEIDLDDVIKNLKKENNFSTSKMRFYWEQMLEAVEEVHSKGIIHADIKPANFVLVKGSLSHFFIPT